jgi:antitoxin MazE
MKTQLARWGNSIAIRIPKSVAVAAELQEGDQMEMAVEGPGIVKMQKPKSKATLKELIRAINAENRHGGDDWSRPVGEELW